MPNQKHCHCNHQLIVPEAILWKDLANLTRILDCNLDCLRMRYVFLGFKFHELRHYSRKNIIEIRVSTLKFELMSFFNFYNRENCQCLFVLYLLTHGDFYLRGHPHMISEFWVGRFLKIGYHQSKIGLTL